MSKVVRRPDTSRTSRRRSTGSFRRRSPTPPSTARRNARSWRFTRTTATSASWSAMMGTALILSKRAPGSAFPACASGPSCSAACCRSNRPSATGRWCQRCSPSAADRLRSDCQPSRRPMQRADVSGAPDSRDGSVAPTEYRSVGRPDCVAQGPSYRGPHMLSDLTDSPDSRARESLPTVKIAEADASVTTIVLADDHRVVRSGLRMLLETDDRFEVLGEAGDLAGAEDLVLTRHPDILVLDLNMAGGASLSAPP